MRIGVTTDLRHSMFSAGHANASFSLASVFKAMGHEVVFLHKQDSEWWDDVSELKDNAPKRMRLSELGTGKLDVCVELAWFLTPEERAAHVAKSIWYCRKPSLFTDLETTVYATRPDGRNLEGLDAIWLADLFTNPDDIVYIETLYPSIPISIVPWIWTPDIVEAHRKQSQSPAWFQMFHHVPKEVPWTLHICETNASTTSSCTLPMVITRYSQLKKKMPVAKVMLHNTDALKANKFFNENVLKHCEVADLSFTMIGRQRIIDWVHEPKSVILAHNRFVPLKMALLEAVWVGIPVVHNSTVLRDLGCGLEQLYYEGNSVTGAATALQSVFSSLENVAYTGSEEGLTGLRKKIIDRFYPLARAAGWADALQRVCTSKVQPQVKPKVLPQVKPQEKPQVQPQVQPQVKPQVQSLPQVNTFKMLPQVNLEAKKSFTVLFTDMWDQFNPKHNMFTLALETALADYTINGTASVSEKPDVVIFGPFGQEWKALDASWPKICYTGENSKPVKAPSVNLNIGYGIPDISDETYLRMPLWMFEIDWFGANLNQIQNPLPLPIDACTTSYTDYSKRDKFCAFVVTNPKNPVRNKAFKILDAYKPVDSAGRLFNTMGDALYAGLGGGGGELKKHQFLKSYRFCLAYENESTPGYTTEKLLHAKAAGCVPIYWGDPKVGRDFDVKGFLNVTSEEELVALVDAVESDATGEAWTKIASVPALSAYSRDLVRRTFSELVKRIVTVAGKAELAKSIPPFLGAKTSEEADAMRSKRTPSFLFVTGTTQRFWPFLLMWLDSIQHHRTVNKAIKARVYVGADVSVSSLEMTKAKYSFAEFIRFPKEYPDEFTDFWDPKHFAWKLWIYKTVVNDPTLDGSMAFYMDTASVLLRWPSEWIDCAQRNGVSLLEDSTQINRHWCHRAFCDALTVTEKELDAQQIIAGLCLFVPGHPIAHRLFNEAYTLACNRAIIVGDKWSGIGADGKPYGHRHDQSILSILSLRSANHRFPLEKVYGEISAKTTLLSGQCVYVHRGSFKSHISFLPGIDDTFVINLNRRQDRKAAFLEAHPYLKGRIKRIEAFDGKTLTLTPTLASLLKGNDFFWKKAVAGCALSHMSAWSLLISQPIDVNAFLIMEDDARLQDGWEDAWRKVYPRLPDGWDCVYLGGVLPPNRPGFAMNLERIADGLARVAPNKVFGQREPTRYFHFCAYAYVLSRKGAEKILQSIMDKGGYWTSADHMICNRADEMNLYVLDPLVAGASQDSDPAYQTSQFNDFSRVDGFDSDLWNNDERFTMEEITECLIKNAPLSINDALIEARAAQKAQAQTAQAQTAQTEVQVHEGPRFVCLKQCNLSNASLYETKWLQDLLPTKIQIEQVSADETLSPNTTLVLIKPLWDEQLDWLTALRKKGLTFKIIHVSDEYATDPTYFYQWPEVTGILRFYTRTDIPVDPKILTVPLGYHRQFPGNRDVPHMSTPELPFRELTWSFAGTDWKGRSQDMQILEAIQPRYIVWYSDWNDPKQMKSDEYISLLLNSIFVPCPKGQNIETYRFYEALDCGCIPLCIDIPPTLEGKLPLLKLESWGHAAALMQHFMQNKEQLEQYRLAVLISWTKYKMDLKEKVRQWAV